MKSPLQALVNVLWISLAIAQPVEARGGFTSHGGSRGGYRSSGHVSVKGYTTKSGTHVQTHKRTSPNGSKRDNWSTKGNHNPYTGKEGTKEP